jgi:hypothetical protein
MGIDHVEDQLPTPKTTKMEQYDQYISYVLRHYEELARFYDIRTAEHAFRNHQGKQRAREVMATSLSLGGKNTTHPGDIILAKIRNAAKIRE